jgi:poly-gamma-glutamate synthesis protein (capsule biosynthesis protein)
MNKPKQPEISDCKTENLAELLQKFAFKNKIRIFITVLFLTSGILACTVEEIEQPPLTTFSFAGDVMMDRGIERTLQNTGIYPFFDVHDLLNDSTFTFVNLETSVSRIGERVNKLYTFKSRPETLSYLTNAGINIVSLANNHTMDYGTIALIHTISNLDVYGIMHTGAGMNIDEATTPVILETNGIKIGVLAYGDIYPISLYARENRPGVAGIYIDRMISNIQTLRESVDFVVVSLHWGIEYDDFIQPVQQRIAYRLIDNGANLIIGHHPHVLQGIERYNDGMIFYSMGNFIFDQRRHIKTRYTMVGKAMLQPEVSKVTNEDKTIGLVTNLNVSYKITPFFKSYDHFMPERPEPEMLTEIMKHIEKICEPYNDPKLDFTLHITNGYTNFWIN